jgi:multiple sugar transport system permease protein
MQPTACYRRLWRYQAGLPTYLENSGGAAFLTIVLCLVLTIPAGYALARFPVPGKEFIFVFLLLALIVPYQSLLTPLFFMFAQLHLTNTLLGLAIVHTTIQIPFSLYIIRNSFEAVPREIEEAAVIDGATLFQVLTRICLPAIRPAIVTLALFAFITSWNEFLGALVIMNRGHLYPPAGSRECASGDQHRRYGLGHVAGRHHHLDHSLRALLSARATILRLRGSQAAR